MLLRAVRLAESGQAVTLLDRALTPGGAWGALDLVGCENVEFGAHLLESRSALYRTLSEDLGVALSPDPCVSVFRGRRFPMRWVRAGFHAAVGLRALARREPDKLRRTWKSAARTALSRSRFLYPAAGASAIVAALCQRLHAAGGRVRLGVSVEGVDVEADGVRVITDAGAESAACALISSRAFAPVTIGGVAQPMTLEHGVCRNMVVRLAAGRETAFSYVEILADSRLKRVRDLSALVRPQMRAPERILCIQHRFPMSGDDIADAAELANDLVRLKLLKAGPEIISAVRTDVPLKTLTDATLARLELEARGRIESLPTTDLADGFMDRQARFVAG